ncbi:hypothetical protein ACFCP7_10410 [Paenibacillus elgii]
MSYPKTPNLNLNKVDRSSPNKTLFNTKPLIDDNMDIIDAALGAQMAEKPPVSVGLKYGQQIIKSDVVAPLTGLQIKGRTLVNLLGRDGNCENASRWQPVNSTLSTEATIFSNGSKSLKVTLTSTTGNAVSINGVSISPAKYYLLAGMVRNGNATNVSLYVSTQQTATQTAVVTDSSKFLFVFKKFTGVTTNNNGAVVSVSGGNGQYAYADEVRLYEITQAEYDAIDSMTPEQIAAKWPYVDDMKSVYSPYVIKYGENLLPPLMEWSLAEQASITGPYQLSLLATGNSQASSIQIPVISRQTYSLSATHNGQLKVESQFGLGDIVANTTSQSVSFTIPSGIDRVYVNVTNGSLGAGTFTFTNLMLNVGPEARPFKPRNDDHLFFPNVQLASNVDGTIYDTLFQRDGKYWKQARFKTLDLDGSLGWRLYQKGSGYRIVEISITDGLSDTEKVIKYDGKIIPHVFPLTAADQSILSTSSQVLRLAISNADSGWGDSYMNVTDDEIKAYFYGWKMKQFGQVDAVPYTSGTKEWVSILQPVGSQTTTLPTTFAPGYKPYKLQYQLSAATVEEIASEGGITLHEGANQFEVGTGMIVRERANPQLITGNYWINGGTTASKLKYRPNKMLSIEANEKETISNWTRLVPSEIAEYGLMNASINQSNFDLGAAYTVTYLALDQYAVSCNPLSLEAARPANMKSVVDTLAAGHADMAARVGALEITRAQRVQPQWIAPTLLNGWVNSTGTPPASYMKDEMGFVHLRGNIRGGAVAVNTPLFRLPVGYRPSGTLYIPTVSNSSFATIFIYADGTVGLNTGGSSTDLSLENILFRGEQ